MRIGITERGDAAVHFYEWRGKLDQVDGAILITKNPQALLDRLNQFDSSKCIFHCTITGWGDTAIEPGAPSTEMSMAAYHKIVNLFGPSRVVLRIDPIIPHYQGFWRAKEVAKHAKGRVRISILDLYPHIIERFKHLPEKIREQYALTPPYKYNLQDMYGGKLHLSLEARKQFCRFFPEAEICGEPDIACTGCISSRDLMALDLEPTSTTTSKQRSYCACAAFKTELLTHRNRCKHKCIYCYWK